VDPDTHRQTLWLRLDEPGVTTTDTCGRTCRGTMRTRNQDNFTIEHLGHDAVLLAVADGLGGMEHGEVASSMAIEQISCSLSEGLKCTDAGDDDQVEALFRGAILKADHTIAARARHHYCKMGTTVCAVLILGGKRAWVANVGDSRCYLLRAGELTQLTRDHTYLSMLAGAGEQSLDDVRRRKYANVLLQAVGSARKTFVDVDRLELMGGDRLMLCSDGLWAPLDHEQLDHRLQAGDNATLTCDALLWEALIAGGNDDLTCIIYQQPAPSISTPKRG